MSVKKTKILNYVSKDYLTFPSNISNASALKQFKKTDLTEAYFTDKDNRYLGKLKLTKILNTDGNSITCKEKKHIKIRPEQSINEIMNVLQNFVGESIPVIDKNNKLIGVISENDVLKAYDEITKIIRNIEKN